VAAPSGGTGVEETPAPRRGEVLARAAWRWRAARTSSGGAHARGGQDALRSAREVQKAINNLEFQAGEGRRLNGETVPSSLPRPSAGPARAVAWCAGDAVEFPGRDPDLEARAGAGVAAIRWY